MPINTLNQLCAAKLQTPRLLDAAERFVMIPDLFNYWLTGNVAARSACAELIAPDPYSSRSGIR